jgi:hypothetical protein
MVLAPTFLQAQGIEPAPAVPRHVLSFSPADLFHKAQAGYEHRLGRYASLGANAFYSYGLWGRYEGWQTVFFCRYFISRDFPVGPYFQAQGAVFNHMYEASLTERNNYRQGLNFDYRGIGGGGGLGLGYRSHVLRRVLGGRLLGNVLVGGRMNFRPVPVYDNARYYPSSGFLGRTDDVNWIFGPGPGSLFHGLLTLDYQF